MPTAIKGLDVRARSLLTLACAAAILVLGAVAPVAGAGDLRVTPETVHRTVEGVPAARDAAGAPVTIDEVPAGAHPAPTDDAVSAAASPEPEPDPEPDADGLASDADDPAGDAQAPDAEGPWRLSAPYAPDIAFSLLGLRLPDGAAAAVRHRQDGGPWSAWEGVHVHPGEGPTPEAAATAAEPADETDETDGDPRRDAQGRWHSLPVWTGPADELQLRVVGADPEDVGVVVVDGLGQNRTVGERTSDALRAVADAVRAPGQPAVASVTQPRIVTRSEWGARASGSPSYASEARAAVLHHTVNGNTYSQQQAPAVVRSIQSYHLDGNGWKDIGYNFLIDRFGTIYEGRAGGITRPVIGAHAGGSNAGSIGVAFMGQHHAALSSPAYAPLPAAAEGSAIDLLSWLFQEHRIDATTGTTLQGGTAFPTWSNRILGHGSVSPTSCPGSGVNTRLPVIREGVVDNAPEPILSVDAPAEDHLLSEGEALTVTGDLDPPGAWTATVVDDVGRELHRSEGWGSRATLTWTPNGDALGALTWTITAQDRPDQSGSVWRPDPRVERVGGAERTETAALLATRGWPDGAEHVVLASAADFPDALAAGPLAGALDAPLLTVSPDGASAAVTDALTALDPDALTVVGGTRALPPAVVAEAAAAAGVPSEAITRHAGANRFATAAEVAAAVIERTEARAALVALGTHPQRNRAWPDALMAGFHGAVSGLPVLLVTPDQVPEATASALVDLDGATLVGGTAAIPDPVADDIAALAPLDARLAGEDRFATAVAVADDPQLAEATDGQQLWAATGRDFPDGLAAGVAAAAAGQPLVLVDGAAAETAAVDLWLATAIQRPVTGVVVGGETAISRDAALAHGRRLADDEE